ncbi:uncharacterized protein LOC136074514 [Hydra vulgaris]|uniref:Uncharacterized protein LOC136074514 n=1 Tax=Hydra vulgaris TaxID=6087 RepID=A0ABM4B289_HYDVU
MKLRVGLLSNDLVDRFSVSLGTVSKIFKSWIRGMSQYLKSFVYFPDEEKVRLNHPDRFKNNQSLLGIFDYSEIFIKTPKDLELQSATWSEYKHHYTMKFLVSVTSSSFINFVSEAYTGRISDKAITLDCNYLTKFAPYSSIMADKGFNIASECAAYRITFISPPGKRGASQMTPKEVVKTSNIAKLRILIEQIIKRMKTFRIIGQEFPISLLDNFYDIIVICAALSNFKCLIMK